MYWPPRYFIRARRAQAEAHICERSRCNLMTQTLYLKLSETSLEKPPQCRHTRRPLHLRTRLLPVNITKKKPYSLSEKYFGACRNLATCYMVN